MNKGGFTLIELIIYTAVFAIIAIILTLFVYNLIGIQAKIKISKDVSENSQRAMEIMLKEIRDAQGVYISTSAFGSHPGQISLITTKNAPEGEQTTYIDFYLDDNSRLCLKRENAEPEAIISEKIKINNLIFNYLTGNNIKSIRIELSAVYNQATTTLISSANLRND